ncbi:hypothetical protein GYA44_02815 [Candidatus Microgenomates bacterium]|nr:hypothetical protein [Candidatus Microgenomates bacterium]
MKDGIKSFLVYILISYVVLDLFEAGIKVPESPLYLLATLAVLVIAMLMACPLLNFLTIKCQFLTYFLMSTLLLFGALYMLKLFMVDFYIEEFVFEGIEFGSILIKNLVFTPLISIALCSVILSFTTAIFRELDVK